MHNMCYWTTLLLCYSGFLYAQEYADGFSFLKIGVGAKACAMGEAFVSIADDGSGVYWNPAGLSKIDRLTFYGMHSERFLGTKLEYFGTMLPAGSSCSVALYGSYLGSGSIDGRDETGQSIGDYQNSDMVAGLVFGWKASRYFRFGIAAKFIMQQVFEKTSTGWSVDGGILGKTPFGINLGVAFQNIGEAYDYNSTEINLPQTSRIGVSYSYLSGSLEIMPAIDFVIDHGLRENIGFNIIIAKFFAIRGGYRLGLVQKCTALGIGIEHSVSGVTLDFDYAFITYSDLGNNQQFSLGIKL